MQKRTCKGSFFHLYEEGGISVVAEAMATCNRSPLLQTKADYVVLEPPRIKPVNEILVYLEDSF